MRSVRWDASASPRRPRRRPIAGRSRLFVFPPLFKKFWWHKKGTRRYDPPSLSPVPSCVERRATGAVSPTLACIHLGLASASLTTILLPLALLVRAAASSASIVDSAVGCMQLLSPQPGPNENKRKVSFATVTKHGGCSTVKSKRRRRSSATLQCGDFACLPVEVRLVPESILRSPGASLETFFPLFPPTDGTRPEGSSPFAEARLSRSDCRA